MSIDALSKQQRNELAAKMIRYVALTQGQACDAIRAFECVVVDTVNNGGHVGISRFGIFELDTKPSGERYIRFRQAVALKAELNPEKPGLKQSVNQAAT